MKEMLGYCGYRCDLCAARSDDPQIRQKMVDGWRKYFGHTNYTAENVRCDGCKADGRLADKSCLARPCAIERGVETCAHCDDFICDKVKILLCSDEWVREKYPDISDEDYNLCIRQFINIPRLRSIREQLGKKWPD
jgi:hypothetical protein